MNGRTARRIRREAERVCVAAGTPTDRGEYQPQHVQFSRGKSARFPERRLMQSPRLLARQMRRAYVRSGGVMPEILLPDRSGIRGYRADG